MWGAPMRSAQKMRPPLGVGVCGVGVGVCLVLIEGRGAGVGSEGRPRGVGGCSGDD